MQYDDNDENNNNNNKKVRFDKDAAVEAEETRQQEGKCIFTSIACFSQPLSN